MSTSPKVHGSGHILALTVLVTAGFTQACSSSNGPQTGGVVCVTGSGGQTNTGGNTASSPTDGIATGGNTGGSNSTGPTLTGASTGGKASGTSAPSGGSAQGTGGAPFVCADTQPPGDTPCAMWKTWGQCGSQWFRDAKLCDITCAVCGGSSSSTGAGGIGSTTGNGGSNGTSTPGSTSAGGNNGSGSGTGGATTTPTVPKTETPFVVPPDAKPTPETSGTAGIFRVNSQGHLTANGTEFQIRGGNWFGLEGQDDIQRPGAMELYIGSVFWGTGKRTIDQTMKEIKAAPLAFNTIRFPVSPQTLVPGHKDGLYSRTDVKIRNNEPSVYPYEDAYAVLEDFLVQADKNGLYVILDMHSCSNHIGWRAGKIDDGPPWVDATRDNYKYKKEDYTCKSGEDAYDKAKWLADIHTLAKLPKKLGIKNIIGIDCFNEPFKYAWSEWADLSKECYDAIAAEDDDLIAIIEGVSGSHGDNINAMVDEPYGDVTTNPNWGENLYGQQFDPIQIPKDRLCFSPHTYGPAVYVQRQFIEQTTACAGLEDDAAGKAKCKLVVERKNTEVVAKLKKGWDNRFGYLHDKGYCVVMGEFGGHTGWPFDNPVKPQAATIWAHAPKDVRFDWEWQNILVDYMVEKKMTDFLYWSINPESGDTGGIYKHAYTVSNESGWGQWQGLDSEKVELLGRLK